MTACIAAEGLDFGMASPATYRAALQSAGFTRITTTSRNLWYRPQARTGLARLLGRVRQNACPCEGRGGYRFCRQTRGKSKGQSLSGDSAIVRQTPGAEGNAAAAQVGRDFVDFNIDDWRRMIPVLDTGEHCPTHLAGQKPL